MIDTLRLSDRLKDSGFDHRQAEGMARALGDELVEHVVTKPDLELAIGQVRADIVKLDNKYVALDAKVEALDAKVEARFEALEARFEALDAKFEARFEAQNTRLDAFGMQIKFIFAALAMLLALGFIDTVPRLLS